MHPQEMYLAKGPTSMASQKQDAPDTGRPSEATVDQGFDPRDTDNPTGAEQAAENDEDESPS